MSFIRTKKIKGNEYAYIVENRWRRKKTKQKSKKYLGRVYRYDKEKEKDFYEYHEIEDIEKYISEKDKHELISDVIRLELYNHGFVPDEEKVFVKKCCFVDVDKKKVFNKRGNNISLAFNEGFLTTYSMRKIFKFKAEDEDDGYEFAKLFVEAGLSVPKEVFVGIFRKMIGFID